MQAISITAFTQDSEQLRAIKIFFKALKIDFELTKQKPYNPEFVNEIMKSKKQYKEGKYTRVKPQELDTFLGLK